MTENSTTDIWSHVSGNEGEIATYLRSLADVLPRATAQRVIAVAKKMERIDQRGGMSGASAQKSALADQDLLAIVSPLLQRAHDHHGDTRSASADLLADLQTGVCRLVRISNVQTSIVGMFAYPGLLLIGLIGIMIFFSQSILPEFRKILTEFGVELPVSTKTVFWVGGFLEKAWPLAVIVAALSALPMVIELCRSAGVASGFVRWIEDKMASRRSAMAAWARHTALLLQAGVDQDAAVETSMLASKRWVRSGKWPWKFGLLEEALKLDNNAVKIAVLNHTADYHHARHRNAVQWWASFLPPIMLFLLAALVVFLLLSIFMPLISIIRGMTGGMF